MRDVALMAVAVVVVHIARTAARSAMTRVAGPGGRRLARLVLLSSPSEPVDIAATKEPWPNAALYALLQRRKCRVVSFIVSVASLACPA